MFSRYYMAFNVMIKKLLAETKPKSYNKEIKNKKIKNKANLTFNKFLKHIHHQLFAVKVFLMKTRAY